MFPSKICLELDKFNIKVQIDIRCLNIIRTNAYDFPSTQNIKNFLQHNTNYNNWVTQFDATQRRNI